MSVLRKKMNKKWKWKWKERRMKMKRKLKSHCSTILSHMIHRYETFNCKIRALNGGINCKIIKYRTNEIKIQWKNTASRKK